MILYLELFFFFEKCYDDTYYDKIGNYHCKQTKPKILIFHMMIIKRITNNDLLDLLEES